MEAASAMADYEVGYGRPPKAHQFQKGRSGNPRGRPRRKVEPPTRPPSLNAFVLEESRRSIAVREGDKVTQMPVGQAMVRKMTTMGMGGNRIALQNVLAMTLAAEREEAADLTELNELLSDMKTHGTQALEHIRSEGGDESELLPHPEDIQFNPLMGRAYVVGPSDAREKAQWDEMAARKRQWLADLKAYEEELEAAGRDEFLECEIAFGHWYVDMLGALYPDEETRRSPNFPIESWPPGPDALGEPPPRFAPTWRRAARKTAA